MKLSRVTKAEQLADHLTQRITDGIYEPGTKLPSETELIGEFGVSRITVRAAVALLRNMGLVKSEQGKGSYVRDQNAALPSTTLDCTVYRAGRNYALDQTFRAVEQPAISRANLAGTTAAMLHREDNPAAFVIDRLLIDEVTSARATHRLVIPFDTAEEVPELEAKPDAPLNDVYGHLAQAFKLSWTDTVTARSPLPDERTTLHMTEGAPLLITYRTTHDKQTNRPLLLEETRVSASSTTLTYRTNARR